MSSYLITGSARGIGFGLATQLSSLPPSEVSIVFATSRSISPELKSLIDGSDGRVVFTKLDCGDRTTIESAFLEVEKVLSARRLKGLDVLINNAGIMNYTKDGIAAVADLSEHLSINVLGVHTVTSVCLPLLQAGEDKKVVNVSSTLGSIAQAPKYRLSSVPAYKISKAALGMLTVQYALTYEDEGFTIFALSPGWLKTDLGSEKADLSVEVGVKATLDVITGAGKDMNGKFLNIKVAGWEDAEGPNQYDGKVVPW